MAAAGKARAKSDKDAKRKKLTPVDEAFPVSVITGFLGSGKTTLLNHLLTHPGMDKVAVLINEFGEVGIDHMLVEKVDDDIVQLNSGCLCCTIRGDLITTMRDLYLRRVRGEIPEFDRLVIETTGLADPAPILHTLMMDPALSAWYRLDGVVTTIDAVHAESQFEDYQEALKQAAVADRILLTKTDLATAEAVAGIENRLHRLNPAASVFRVDHGEIDPAKLFDAGLYNPKDKHPDVAGWLHAEAYGPGDDGQHGGHHHGHAHDSDGDTGEDHDHDNLDRNRHDDRVAAFCLTIDMPIDWDALVAWIQTLTHYRGEDLLRIKGVVNVAGEDQPVVIHGVQHVFHPPVVLESWPDPKDRRSKIVFITRDITRDFIEKSLTAYIAAAAERQAPAPA